MDTNKRWSFHLQWHEVVLLKKNQNLAFVAEGDQPYRTAKLSYQLAKMNLTCTCRRNIIPYTCNKDCSTLVLELLAFCIWPLRQTVSCFSVDLYDTLLLARKGWRRKESFGKKENKNYVYPWALRNFSLPFFYHFSWILERYAFMCVLIAKMCCLMFRINHT